MFGFTRGGDLHTLGASAIFFARGAAASSPPVCLCYSSCCCGRQNPSLVARQTDVPCILHRPGTGAGPQARFYFIRGPPSCLRGSRVLRRSHTHVLSPTACQYQRSAVVKALCLLSSHHRSILHAKIDLERTRQSPFSLIPRARQIANL